jgi:hypothetical protein
MTTVSHLGNSPGAQCGYRPRDKAGQNAKLSPNVPPWRSADCRDRTGQKPKALSRMSRCAIAPFGPKRALPTLTLFGTNPVWRSGLTLAPNTRSWH